ncbi:MAG: hypothetical protein WCO11_00795 [Sphingomonadales bacterium]|jgi:hypothetical protein
MRANSLFYQCQIDQCAANAAAAGLSNQRDMFLRAQAAWQGLADKEAAAESERLKRRVV